MSTSWSLVYILLQISLIRVCHGVRVNATELYKFPNATLLENLALRGHSGHLLLTAVSSGELFEFDPQASNAKPRPLGELPGATGCTGVVEVEPDVFAVAGGVINLTSTSYLEGSVRVYRADFRQRNEHGRSVPTISVAAKVANTTMLNGMVALPGLPGVVLSVDSFYGRMFRIDTKTGHYEVLWQDETFAGMNNTHPGGTQLGANGLKLHDGWLYFSNSAQRTFGRVRITPGGHRIGRIETFPTIPADKPGSWADDDFAITDKGVIYVARHPSQLVKIGPWGHQEVVLGENGTVQLEDPSAAIFDPVRNAVFVVTDGTAVAGGTGGGQVVQILLD